MSMTLKPFQPKPQTSVHFEASVKRKVLNEAGCPGGVSEAFDDVVILGGARTPFAKIGGSFRQVPAYELLLTAMKGAVEKTGVNPADINQVMVGNIISSSTQAGFYPRNLTADLGVPEGTIAHKSDRLCGTGFELVRQAANQLTDGGDSVIITGGVENMSQTPVMDTDRMLMEEFAKGQMEKGGIKGKVIGWMLKRKLGKAKPYTNPLNEGLTDPKADIMIGTADKLAKMKGLTREQADAFAAESQKRAKAAVDGGRVKEEIRPVRQTDLQKGKLPKGVTEVTKDEHLRETNAQKLGKLKTIMTNKEDAIHTAGSSSGIVDGAAAIVVSTGAMAKSKNLPILAKLKAVAVTGCDPKIMGFGPARAIPAALEAAGVKMEDVSYVEVNEAFAGQALAVQKALNIPDSKFNPDGGAIAFGHPLSATGGRITLHAAHRLKQDNAKYAVVSACIGGGQGIAMVLENPEA